MSCPLCYETFSRPPRLLRCGHSICQTCTKRFCSATASDFRKECPFCRQISIAHQLNDFPKNFALESIIESAAEISERSPDFCRNFDSNLRLENQRFQAKIRDLSGEASKFQAELRDLKKQLNVWKLVAFFSMGLMIAVILKTWKH